MMFSLLLWAPMVSAQDFVTEIGEVVALERGANWVRTFPKDDDTWWLTLGLGGDYGVTTITKDLVWDEKGLVGLTGRTYLIDNAIMRCSDGTYFHAASASLDQPNDSAYAFGYGEDWSLLHEGAVEERVSGTAHNDMALLCGGDHRLVAFSSMGGSVFHHVDKSGTITKKTTSPDIKFINGGGMLHDPETGGVLLVTNGQNSNTLYLYELDAELAVVERRDLEFAPSGQRAYWPQGFIRVNEHFVVVGMARSDSAGWSQDTGDVWLAVLDKDLNVVETHQVTQFEVPEGAMRPSVSRNGDTLLVTFDRLVRPNFVKVTIDLKAFGLDGGGSPGDTDLPADDSAPGGDDTSGGGGDKGDGGGGCGGCATGSGGVSALAALMGLVAVRRRRSGGVEPR